jgi:hypothetical protein
MSHRAKSEDMVIVSYVRRVGAYGNEGGYFIECHKDDAGALPVYRIRSVAA